jgi:hypothetical protein
MRSSPANQRRYTPETLQDVAEEFPGWIIDKATSGRFYARGPAILSGANLAELWSELIKWTWRNS